MRLRPRRTPGTRAFRCLAALPPLLALACNLEVHLPVLESASSTSSPEASSSSTSSSTTTEPTASTGASFITGNDSAKSPSPPGCDVFAQDCPEGQKCAWTSYSDFEETMGCVPLAPAPRQPGEPCVYEIDPEDQWSSGVDDCDKGAMCLGNEKPGQGICVGLCKGSAWAPYCDEGYTCVGGRTHWYCQRDCDPLIQDCPAGYRCELDLRGYSFACQIEHDTKYAAPGKPCDWDSDCEPGSICVDGQGVPGCPTEGCCTKYCDLADPAFDCGLEGQQCETVEVSQGVKWPEDLGICLLPGVP